MSLTRDSLSVPFVPHSSHPCARSAALKYRVLPIAVSSKGSEPVGPGRLFLTKTVPPDVPSLLHNFPPRVPLVAPKYKESPSCVSSYGPEPTGPRLMSLTMAV